MININWFIGNYFYKSIQREDGMKTKVINKDSFFLMRWFIKWYIWVWRPNLATLTDCKLFWGTLFSPLAFLSAKREFGIVPRIFLLYVFIALILFAIGIHFLSGVLVILAVLILLSSLFHKESTESVSADIAKEEDAEENDEEEFECPRFEVFYEKFFNSRLGLKILILIFSIIDFKERKCSFIKIE